MVVGPGITGPPCQTRGGEAPSGLVGSHKGPEMACALTMPLNRPIFAGSRDAQAPAFVVPAAAEPVVVSRPAASMPKASSTWEPATAVVYVGRTSGECAGPSASVCCRYINFFGARTAAAAWAASHPEITGGILGQDRALQVGIGIFGQLLS